MVKTFWIDQFTLKRGGPAWLYISCSKCKSYVMDYQKDGPGPLLRCYLDRIHAPKSLFKLHEKSTLPPYLMCKGCNKKLGCLAIYEKEDRWAFFLVEEAIQYVEKFIKN